MLRESMVYRSQYYRDEGCLNEMAGAWGQKLDWNEFNSEWKVRKYK